ncbi:cytosine permease, partial [Micromonospora fiedleri]|uniref:cytosine permease n=1 Tax=Micromonospora fiedleri TaxID=1157498 RepID=UPI001EE37FFD
MGANLQITAIVTGALAVVLGGDVFWSLIGLLIGQLLGGGVMALHAAQGPKLGLPQMISSRVQFGVYGAAIPIVLVCLMYPVSYTHLDVYKRQEQGLTVPTPPAVSPLAANMGDSPAPLYARVKQMITQQIDSGNWPPHYRVPSESELV